MSKETLVEALKVVDVPCALDKLAVYALFSIPMLVHSYILLNSSMPQSLEACPKIYKLYFNDHLMYSGIHHFLTIRSPFIDALESFDCGF